MTMNLKDEIKDFNSIFEFASEKEATEHEARMIMYRFLSEIERKSPLKRGLKKHLSKSINKSSSFVTQLFNGDKIVNLVTLAKFQKVLGIKFKITAYSEDKFDYYSHSAESELVKNIFILNSLQIPSNNISEGENASGYTQVIEKSNPLLS